MFVFLGANCGEACSMPHLASELLLQQVPIEAHWGENHTAPCSVEEQWTEQLMGVYGVDNVCMAVIHVTLRVMLVFVFHWTVFLGLF